MATTPVTTRAYPKRKRAEISYHESSSGEGEEDDEYGTSDEVLVTTTTRKVRGSIMADFTARMSSDNLL